MNSPTWIDSLLTLWQLFRGLCVDWPRHLFSLPCTTWVVLLGTWIICHVLYIGSSQKSTHGSIWLTVDFFIDLCIGFGALFLSWREHLLLDGLL